MLATTSIGAVFSSCSPDFGDRELTDKTNRLSYPFGVTLNARGKRFIDEGEDQFDPRRTVVLRDRVAVVKMTYLVLI